MTTNVGARALTSHPVGFSAEARVEERSLKAVQDVFTPEFRNRLTRIVQFHPLPPEIAERIVEKMVYELEERLKSKKIDLELDASARTWLANNGYDKHYGARPLRRLIEQEISHALSSEILFGELQKGGRVRILADEDGIRFDIEPRK